MQNDALGTKDLNTMEHMPYFMEIMVGMDLARQAVESAPTLRCMFFGGWHGNQAGMIFRTLQHEFRLCGDMETGLYSLRRASNSAGYLVGVALDEILAAISQLGARHIPIPDHAANCRERIRVVVEQARGLLSERPPFPGGEDGSAFSSVMRPIRDKDYTRPELEFIKAKTLDAYVHMLGFYVLTTGKTYRVHGYADDPWMYSIREHPSGLGPPGRCRIDVMLQCMDDLADGKPLPGDWTPAPAVL